MLTQRPHKWGDLRWADYLAKAQAFTAIAKPILDAYGSYGDVAAATGKTYNAAMKRCRYYGLQSKRRSGTFTRAERAERKARKEALA